MNVIEDGEGPHVHVWKAGTEYRVGLYKRTARLWTVGGMRATKAQQRAAEAHVQPHLAACWKEWKKWHG